MVEGRDPGGGFKQEARTVSINRHGARIRIGRRLQSGQSLRLVNQLTRRTGEFRVVGPVSPPVDNVGEWAVECLSTDDNIWGIYFPPIPEGAIPEATALVECRGCHTVAVLRLTLVESEVLQTAGLFSKACDACEKETTWGHVEKQIEAETPPEGVGSGGQEPGSKGSGGSRVNRRKHPRASVQLPVRLRDYYGGTEVVQSTNACKGGFCFTSERDYELGQGLLTICPYNSSLPGAEVTAHIVHFRPTPATKKKVYGVRYELQK